MKKLLSLLCLLLALLPGALAENVPEPFTGYFEKTVFLRPEPAASSESLASIPAGTPIDLVPVNDRFAEVTWQGKTGYVYYAEVQQLPEETPVPPYLAYLPENKYLFALALDGAPSLLTVQAETPVTVTAEAGRFLRIETNGQSGFVYARDTEAIDDMHMEASDTEFWVETAVTTRVYPLKNAEEALTLEPSRIYIAEAVCNGYYRVTVGEETVYVPARSAQTIQRGKETARAAIITPDTVIFTAPEQSAVSDNRIAEACLFLLGPMENGFQQLDNVPEAYVRANDVAAYVVNVTEPQCLRLLADAPLLLSPEEGAAETASVQAGQLYEVTYAMEDWYLLKVNGRWGFLRRDERIAAPLVLDGQMMRTAAVMTADAPYYASGITQLLHEGVRLTLTGSAGDFYRCEAYGQTGYVLKEAVDVLGSDTPLTPYTVTAPADIDVLDFPDAALGFVDGTIPAGSRVRVTGFNRCYLMVTWNGLTGYARQEGLLTGESVGIPATEDVPACELVLDKSTGMVYAFLLNTDGTRGELLICAEVGTGKRTTPTPSGTFLLGKKERWHAFTLSYTPHTTEYVKARYIHGWPCERKSESTVKKSLVRTGMVTGGCLRSPFDFARWVYMNCTSYETQLVIVSGGFEAPANAADVQVQ